MCDLADVADRALAALRRAPGLTGSTLAERLAAEGICAPHADVAIRQLHRKAKIAGPKGQPLPKDLSLDDLRLQALAVVTEPEWIVGGRYRVFRDQLLGAGAAAKVYRAEHLKLRRPAAMKIIRPVDSPMESARAEILRRALAEPQVLASLHHPHILPVFDSGEEDGTTWIATALCEGGNLASRIRREGPLPSKVVAEIMAAVAEALDAAAQSGVIHRDVKPENILFDLAGRVYVGDFGLARIQPLPGQTAGYADLQPATAPGTAVGTPQYLAPERANGERGDLRSDEYSLGATAYEMATGLPLFDLDQKPEMQLQWLYHQINARPEPISKRRPEFPRELEEIISRCLAKSPGDRYQTMRSLVRDLRRFIASLPSPETERIEVSPVVEAPQVAGPVTQKVSSFLASVDVDLVIAQSAYEEKFGKACFETPEFLRPFWSIMAEKGLLGFCAKLQSVVAPEQFKEALDRTLAGAELGSETWALPNDPIDYLWLAVHKVAKAKAEGQIPDTSAVEALHGFLKATIDDPRLPLPAPPAAPSTPEPVLDAAEIPVAQPTSSLPAGALPAVDDDLIPPGLVVGDRLRVLHLIARGGFGAVYRANDMFLDRDVALKVMLNTGAPADAESQSRFLREARTAAKLKHDNVVSVYEANFWEIETPFGRKRVPYLVMELVQGKTLTLHRAERERLAVDEALSISRQALSGLAAAHALGLVHRDIKPDNIMIDEAGVVRLMDFGLARSMHLSLDNVTATGVFYGTVEYASPEQLGTADPVDGRSDLYSLGVVLYELLSGVRPYTTTSPNKLPLAKDIADPAHQPARLRSVAAGVPEAVDQFVHRLLAKRREDRPSGAVEAINELDALIESLSHPVKPKRRIAGALALAAGALLVAVAVAASPLLRRDAKPSGSTAENAEKRSDERHEEPPPAKDGAAAKKNEPPKEEPKDPPIEALKADGKPDEKPAPKGEPLAERLRRYTTTDAELALIADMRTVFAKGAPAFTSRDFALAASDLAALAGDARQTDHTHLLHRGASTLLDLAAKCVAARHGDLKNAPGAVTVRLSDGRVLTGAVKASDDAGFTLSTDGSASVRVAFGQLALEDYLGAAGQERGRLALRIVSGDSSEALTDLGALSLSEESVSLWLPFAVTMAQIRAGALVGTDRHAEARLSFGRLVALAKDAVDLFRWLKPEFEQASREEQALALLLEGKWAEVVVGFDRSLARPIAAKRLFDAATATFKDDLIANELVLDWVLRPEEKKDSIKFFDLYDKDGVEGLILRDPTGQHSVLPKHPLPTVAQGLSIAFRATFKEASSHLRMSLSSTKGGAHLRLDSKNLSLRRSRMEGPESDILATAPVIPVKDDAWRTLTLVPSVATQNVFVYLDGALMFHAPVEDAAIAPQFAITVSAAEVVIRSVMAKPVK